MFGPGWGWGREVRAERAKSVRGPICVLDEPRSNRAMPCRPIVVNVLDEPRPNRVVPGRPIVVNVRPRHGLQACSCRPGPTKSHAGPGLSRAIFPCRRPAQLYSYGQGHMNHFISGFCAQIDERKPSVKKI